MTRLGNASRQAMLKTVLLTSLAMTVPIVGVRMLGGLEGLELAAYDDFMRRRPAEEVDDRIVIVTVSDNDIEQLQQYPIHDGTLAIALEKLESYQPRAIGLDISRDVPQGSLAGRKRLTQVIENSETIVSGCLLSTEKHPGSPPAPGTPAEGVGFAGFPADPDIITRRVSLVSTPAKSEKTTAMQHICNKVNSENEVQSLSFQLVQLYLAGEGIEPDSAATGEIRFRQQILRRLDSHFGGYAHADANDYQMMMNYRGADQVFREISLSEVLQPIEPELIRDRVVLIGNTSEVSKDFLSTPYIETQIGSRNMHGVMVHAHAVSQILSAVMDQRPLIQSWSEVGEVLWIGLWSLSCGLIAFYNRRLGFFIIVLISSSVILWGVCYGLFLYQGLWIPFVPTLIAAVFTALGVRLVDLASRTGYAQAIYEQLREQMQGEDAKGDRKGDYLENLVRRARLIRQSQDAATLVDLDDDSVAFATPEMRALYEQIATRVREDIAAEQSAQQARMAKSRSNSRANRIQTLLSRAQQYRKQLSIQTIHTKENT